LAGRGIDAIATYRDIPTSAPVQLGESEEISVDLGRLLDVIGRGQRGAG